MGTDEFAGPQAARRGKFQSACRMEQETFAFERRWLVQVRIANSNDVDFKKGLLITSTARTDDSAAKTKCNCLQNPKGVGIGQAKH